MKNVDNLTPEERQAYAIAYLLAEQKLGQAEAGQLLRLSQTTISRRVRLAKEMGVLQETPRFIAPPSAYTKQLEAQWGKPYAVYEAKIQERYNKKLRRVKVFKSRDTIESRDDWDKAVETFGKVAASHVLDLLSHSRVVGIAYGRILKSIVWGVRDQLQVIPANRPKAEVIPLWGSLHGSRRIDLEDPRLGKIFTKPIEFSSDFMAKELQELLNAKAKDYSLETVPSFLPPEFFESEGPKRIHDDVLREKAVLRLFQNKKLSAHEKIFGDGRTGGKIAEASMLLVAVSSPEDLAIDRFYQAWLMEWLGLDERQLREKFVGDIGLVLIGKGPDGQERAEQLDSLSFCLKREHLEICAKNAQPGVVVIAVGKARATILHECINQGLVNEAVIDQHCAFALCEL